MILLDSTTVVWYPVNKAKELATMLQKNDPEWNYVVRESDAMAMIEVLDPEGFHLGYL